MFDSIICLNGLLHIFKGHILYFTKYITFLSLRIVLVYQVLVIIVDIYEMPQVATFHLCLHCLPKYQ